MSLERDLRDWAARKIGAYGYDTITGQVAGEVLDILNSNTSGTAAWADEVCPHCDIPWGKVSPDCPRTVWDRHPGTVHDDGHRYLCRMRRVSTKRR